MPSDNAFFERPIRNSPYEYPSRHWELDYLVEKGVVEKQGTTGKGVRHVLAKGAAKGPNGPRRRGNSRQSVIERTGQTAIEVAYQRRNRDLDPQLVWRGKDEQDWSDLVVTPAPQEKVQSVV